MGAILSGISAHCPGNQTFLSEEHLKELAMHIQLVKMIQTVLLNRVNSSPQGE